MENQGEIMIIRMLLILILATAVNAGEFIDDWEPDKIEKLTYEIRTFQPSETVNYSDLEITRIKDKEPTFIVKQVLRIPSQAILIQSTETYAGENLQIVSSENSIKLPEQAAKKLEVDTLVIKARADKGELTISFNSHRLPRSVIPLTGPLTTTVGFRLVSRNMDFKIGNTFDYEFINLLTLADTISKAPKARDSIVGIEKIQTPVGSFECYKVKNMVSGSISYNYYTTDTRHIPVKTEIIDPRSGKLTMTLTLQKYQ